VVDIKQCALCPLKQDTAAPAAGFFQDFPHGLCIGQDLWGEADEQKRIDGWKAVDKYIAENAYVIPLIQYQQPIIFKKSIKVTPNVAGSPEPAQMSPA
jgi:hypothetical protein